MILPTHSRTSSSASSVGSSYVSSTDSNKTSHIESPTPSLQSHALDIVQNSDFHTINNGTSTLPPYQSLCKLINEPIHHQNGIKNHHHQHHHNNNNNCNINNYNNYNYNNHNEHEDASDTDQIDYTDLHHESIKFNNNKNNGKLAVAINQTNDNVDESIFNAMKTSDDNGCDDDVGGENFAYKTLNGDVIRSVVAPGKGKSINYKVSQIDCQQTTKLLQQQEKKKTIALCLHFCDFVFNSFL